MDDDRADKVRRRVNEIYALAAAGNLEAIRPMLAADFTFVEADDLVIGGTYAGFEGYQAIWGKVAGLWSSVASRVLDLAVSASNAVGLMELEVVSVRDGKTYVLEVAELFEFADDLQLKRIKPFYFDTAQANRSMGAD